jgi:hypothetical protein
VKEQQSIAALSLLYTKPDRIMKRIPILMVLLSIASQQAAAQEPADALRYSWLTPGGTARNQAIGGANVGLGGDISSLFYNPAGLGLYKTGEFVITPAFGFKNNKTDYLGTAASQKDNNFQLGATGLVLPMPTRGGGNWKNVTLGIGLNRTADFNNTVYFNGLNNQSSYSEKYLEELINNNVQDPNSAAQNFPYGASLAFNTFLVDTLSGPGGTIRGYKSMATPRTGVNQQQTVTTSGGLSEFSFGISGNLKDKLFLGGSVNWGILNFQRTTSYRESDATNNTRNNFNYFTVDETLATSGLGVNVKLGLIFKPVDQLRLGFAFHSPTLYNMEDGYSAEVSTDLEGYGGPGVKTQSSRDFNNGLDGEFAYNLNNPMRLMGGVAYVLREDRDVTKQKGFISADVEFVDYRASSFSSSDPANNSASYYNDLNGTIDRLYRSAINARLGGELKFNTLMVRAGFAYFGNPYQGSEVKGSRMNLSGGIGYRDKGKFFDLTYVHQIGKDGYFPYRLENGFFSPVDLRSGIGNLMLTVGFKF